MPTKRELARETVATYASVLVDEAYKAGGQDAVMEIRNQLESILRISRSNLDLATSLDVEKGQIVRNVFVDANPVLVEVLAVMATRGDFALLSRVWVSYQEQLESKLGVTVVDVTTVVPLDDKLREQIIKKTEADLGTKAVLNEKIDKSIIGGIIMSAQGRRIDASVLSQLEKARNVLKDS